MASNNPGGHSGAQKTTLVCFAVKEEAAPFLKFAKNNPSITVLITGMGRKHAEHALLQSLPKSLPSLVLTCGFAGALDPRLKIGDVVFDVDPESRLAPTLQEAGALPPRPVGPLHGVPVLVKELFDVAGHETTGCSEAFRGHTASGDAFAGQGLVPAGAWQSARSLGAWTLLGCTVAPGFDFAGFEHAPEGFEP